MANARVRPTADWYLAAIARVAPNVAGRYQFSPVRTAQLWRAYLAGAPRG